MIFVHEYVYILYLCIRLHILSAGRDVFKSAPHKSAVTATETAARYDDARCSCEEHYLTICTAVCAFDCLLELFICWSEWIDRSFRSTSKWHYPPPVHRPRGCCCHCHFFCFKKREIFISVQAFIDFWWPSFLVLVDK